MTPALPRLAEVAELLYGGRALPAVAPVRQHIDTAFIANPASEAAAAVEAWARKSRRARGPIAVGVGSRGIAGIEGLVRSTVQALKAAGFAPFIVPAMGSHAGATGEAQAATLAGFGITEETMGVPVQATMDTAEIGEVDGIPVYMDRNVVACGGVFLVCRIKPHTDFTGPIESGLSKMCAIGLGKQRGAQTMHSAGVRGLREVMPRAAQLAAERGILAGGLAVVENQLDQTAIVRVIDGPDVGGPIEIDLLAMAYRLLPRIPFDQLDVLVIDRMGKEISGTGIDSNVINRLRVSGEPEPGGLKITHVVVLDLTDASHGNAGGIGLADFITARLFGKVDLAWTYTNGLTAGITGVLRVHLPVILPTDRDAVVAAHSACGRAEGEPVRLAWIQDTLHTETFAVSEALLPEIQTREDLDQLDSPGPMPFDANGRLQPLADWMTTSRGAGYQR